ncbi:cathepsin O isoform X1 [Paralichthys olivaceus]|uniref:cathepsin O isoform X1 n=1 Tax=Paralichthys olivaceus TaxID=8255 RepID=UPI003751DF03
MRQTPAPLPQTPKRVVRVMFACFHLTPLRQMRVRQVFVLVAVSVCSLVSPLRVLRVCSDETENTLNSSDFHSFRKQFQRQSDVSSEELNRRRVYFQVRFRFRRDAKKNYFERNLGVRHCRPRPLRYMNVDFTAPNSLFVSLQDARKRQAYLNSFSTAPQSAKYGINQFSDLSQKEFRDLYLRASADRAPHFSGPKTEGLPAKFDWRDKAAVTPVRNQQACGSCWAFSVVGAVQSAHAIEGSQLEQLSVQQVLDCSIKNEGCNGGSPLRALNWLKQTRVKLVPQSEYPYKAKTGICHFFSQSHDGVAVKNFAAHDFGGQEEAMMGQLLEHGPLAAVVDAVSWQDYQGGIIQHHCSSQWSNHAVLVVGYDTTGDIPYWIVQNSWGPTWGNEGYVYIKIGGNICGMIFASFHSPLISPFTLVHDCRCTHCPLGD